MRLFSDETREARQTLIAARQHLAEVSDRDREVTDDYLDANTAVIAAETPLAWWQRLDVDAGHHDDGPAAKFTSSATDTDDDTDTY